MGQAVRGRFLQAASVWAILTPLAGPALADDLPPLGEAQAKQTRQVYAPVYFAPFAPRNAFDMLEKVPGFTLQEADTSSRGLGQASGNVLINGERLPGKSDTAEQQLTRINAGDVVRIEIVDGATLDIPGLSGQVANIVVRQDGFSGQFTWKPQTGNDYARYNLTKGDISAGASLGPADITLALSDASHHGGSIGPSLITAGDGTLIDDRRLFTHARAEDPKVSATVRIELPGGSVANLSASHEWYDYEWRRREERYPVLGDESLRHLERDDQYRDYEIGANVEFRLGPGRLKLIGLDSGETRDYATQAVIETGETEPDTGDRYELHSESGERIARAEYRWPMLGGDWQISSEAAFNRLDNVSGLFTLDPDGSFTAIPFPAGTGGVREERYETILSYGRALTRNLSLQIAAGGEYSKIVQTGSAAAERSFRRPKGSASLAWAAAPGLDLSLRLNRRIGQLEFGDFLAQVFVDSDNQNGGNNQLVPEQSWEAQLEIAKDLGIWGSARLKLERDWIKDVVTYIPLPDGGESLGNVDRASRDLLTFDSTVKFDPLGFAGARLDLLLELENSSIPDPLTGTPRPIDDTDSFNIEGEFRHDIPHSAWAWGFVLQRTHLGSYYRIAEIGEDDGFRKWGEVYLENKDVFGLTMRATYSNLFDETSRTHRTFYDGPRDLAPVLYREWSDRKLGRYWAFVVKGSF